MSVHSANSMSTAGTDTSSPATAPVPRAIQHFDQAATLEVDGLCFTVSTRDRTVVWSNAWGRLPTLPGVERAYGGPATYGHITTRYTGPIPDPAYQPTRAADLRPKDLITQDGEPRTLTAVHTTSGGTALWADSPDYSGPYRRPSDQLLPLLARG
jgi:hypothetical protein